MIYMRLKREGNLNLKGDLMDRQKSPTQEEEVYDYLLGHEFINQSIATEVLGCTRLSAIIFNLKRLGIPIESKLVFYKKKNGRIGRFSNYWLESSL